MNLRTCLHVFVTCALFLFTAMATAQTESIKKLQRELPKSRDSLAYTDKLNRIAVLMHMKNPDSCFLYAVKAKHIAMRHGYKKGEADANNVLAIALSLKGLHHDALKLYSQTLADYQKMNEPAKAAMVYMNMASSHRYLSDSISSVRNLRKGINLARKRPNDSIMSVVYSAYADLAPGLSKDSSRYYSDKAIKIATRYKDQRVLIMNRLLGVTLILNTDRHNEALPILEQALADAKAAGLEFVQISVYDLLAKYYANDPRKAVSYYETVLKLLDDNGYINLKSIVLQRMMPYAERTGDKDLQVKLAKELAVVVADKQARLSAFFNDYVNYNDLEDKNELLQVTTAAEQKRTKILAIFSTGSVILLLGIFYLYRKTKQRSRQKSELNRIIMQKNAELESNDAFKTKLVSILAHDFRSPLISTVSLVEILKSDTKLSPNEMNTFYSQIQTDINDMLDRFDSTLQWIRQQLKGHSIMPEELYARPLIDEATQVFAAELQQKGVKVKNEMATNLKIRTDKEILQFINRNLISNAIKYSPKNGTITVSAATQDGMLTVRVSDQGKGLDEKTAESLFSINANGSTRNGAGIALSMCRDFIEKLGGKIWAGNGEDGAVFCYQLPV